jgi:hypothetical protein
MVQRLNVTSTLSWVVGHVEPLPVEPGPLHRQRGAGAPPLGQLPAQVGRLDGGDGRDLAGIPPHVEPAAEADLQHPAGQPGARDLAHLTDLATSQAQVRQTRHDALVPHP